MLHLFRSALANDATTALPGGHTPIKPVVLSPTRDNDPLCRASKNGRQQSIAGVGKYRVGRADASTSLPARCWDRFQCSASTWPRKGGGKRATFQRFAAMWLRHAASV